MTTISSSETFVKRRTIFLSIRKTVNIQGYSELQEPIKTHHFSLRSQNSEYPRIFRVTGANQNSRKLLSSDLVKTNVL